MNDRDLLAIVAAIIYSGHKSHDLHLSTHDAVVKASDIIFEVESRPGIERTKRQ
jgi:hypothetical protein